MFSRFVPENVVDEVLARADEGLRLGGVEREATVMFTDLRGFTSFAESMGPEQVIDVLNQYLSEMSDAIMDHGGTLVAYMGDGIMAVFGAPIEQDDHADRALAAAREMLEVRLERFNEWMQVAGARRRLPDGHRLEQRIRHVGQRRLRAPPRVHGDRRHHQHRVAARGHDEGHAAPAVRGGLHPRAAQGPAGGPGLRGRVRGARQGGEDQALDARRRPAGEVARARRRRARARRARACGSSDPPPPSRTDWRRRQDPSRASRRRRAAGRRPGPCGAGRSQPPPRCAAAPMSSASQTRAGTNASV